MGQIIGGAAKPKRCNLNKLSQLGTPTAGEYILVSSDNSMNAAGQGNFDCYIVGDGTTAATALELHYVESTREEVNELVNKTKNTIIHTRNLADSAVRDDSHFINSSTRIGTEAGNILIIFPCSPSTTYTISKIKTSRFRVAYFNEYPKYNVLGYGVITNHSAEHITITTGESATYIAAWVYNSSGETVTRDAVMDSLQIELGSVATEYIAPRFTAVDYTARQTIENYTPVNNLITYDPTKPLAANQGVVLKRMLDTGVEALEPDASVDNAYVNWSTGVIEANNEYHYFDHTVKSGDVLLLTVPKAGSAVAVIAMYAGNDYVKDYSSVQYGGNFFVIVPSTITNIRISLRKTKTYSIRKSSLIHYDSQKSLILRHSGAYYYINEGNDFIQMADGSSSRNKNLNFHSVTKNGTVYDASDDITPMHILNTTLGGNHAQPVTEATITAHGFVDSDLGTAWTHSNGDVYYLVRIVNENTARFLSANKGTQSSPIFQYMPVGTLVRNDNTKTISAVTSSQMWPGIKNESYNIIVDGITIENAMGDVYGNVIDFVESYDIMNPASILENLVANVGNNVNGVYDGDVAVHADITYRFLRGLNRIVMTNYNVVQDEIKFSNMMFSQKTGSTTAKYYTPNNTAFAVPEVFSSGETTIISESNTIKDTGVPCNRVLQYYEDKNFAFAVGILTDIGVGKNMRNYTDEYFELRGSTKKIYPTPVNFSKVGSTLQSGDMFTALMYYAIADIGTGYRQSLYHFNLNGEVYVFVDYSGSMVDKVSISDALNGRQIKVIEASNAEIINMKGNSEPYEQNNIYNGGFYVKANYVVGETCYIVVKI